MKLGQFEPHRWQPEAQNGALGAKAAIRPGFGSLRGMNSMTCNFKRWSRQTLPLWIVCLFTPVARAQPVIWGTASPNASFPQGRLLRIDYASGAIQATFNGPPGFIIGDGFTGVAVRPSNGQVFVTDGSGSNRIYRFDPATGSVLGFFPSPTGTNTLDGLEFLGNVLYAQQIAQSTIVRIDPDTGALLGTLPMTIPSGAQGGLTIVDGFLFSHGNTANTTIARRDLLTGAILSEFATPNNEPVTGLATDGDSLFASSSAGVIYRLNPDNGSVLDSRNIGITLDGLGGPIPIPEPSAALLLFTTFVVGYVRRRKGSARTS
jgi:hypothetical protein